MVRQVRQKKGPSTKRDGGLCFQNEKRTNAGVSEELRGQAERDKKRKGSRARQERENLGGQQKSEPEGVLGEGGSD